MPGRAQAGAAVQSPYADAVGLTVLLFMCTEGGGGNSREVSVQVAPGDKTTGRV
mgnify:CR=1 FL=1